MTKAEKFADLVQVRRMRHGRGLKALFDTINSCDEIIARVRDTDIKFVDGSTLELNVVFKNETNNMFRD